LDDEITRAWNQLTKLVEGIDREHLPSPYWLSSMRATLEWLEDATKRQLWEQYAQEVNRMMEFK